MVKPRAQAPPAMLKDATLSRVLLDHSKLMPERVSIFLLHNNQPAKELTYSHLVERASNTAAVLKRRGVQPGDVVIIILNHGEDLIFAFFGAVLAGAIPSIMPFLTEKLSPDQYRKSLSALFDVTLPGAVITYQGFEHEVEQAVADSGASPVILVAENIPASSDVNPDLIQGITSTPEDTALLQHSSGTTGLQKGVALSHQAVFNQLSSYADSIRIAPQDVIVSWLPLYHDMGLIAGFLLPVMLGVPLVLMSPFDWVRAPYRLFKAISDYQGSLCWLPNFAYNFCAQKVRDPDLQGVDLSCLRAVINCSEPMYWSSHKMFLERFQPYGFRESALATSYAMAENVFAVTQGGIDAPVAEELIDHNSLMTRHIAVIPQDGSEGVRMLSAGKTIPHTSLRIIDSDGNNLPDRHVGEIAIQSNCMLTSYYNRPDLTNKAFLDGWYLTGDLGYLAGEELYITGRKKDLIIIGGKNVYPQDLELLAGEVNGVHPGRLAAFGVPNEQTGTEDVVIAAEVDILDRDKRQRIADEIRQKVTRGSDIALRHVHIVDRGWLVKTSSGKVARAANREKYLSEL